MKICSFNGCERNHWGKGFCSTHYQMQRRGKILQKIGVARQKKESKECCIPLCTNLHRAKGYCSTHYNQISKNGAIKNKVVVVKIPKTKMPKAAKSCCIANCDSETKIIKGLCVKHYCRIRAHGDPHVCYSRKHRNKPLNIMPSEDIYRLTHDEKELLEEIFIEQVGKNEGENIYSID